MIRWLKWNLMWCLVVLIVTYVCFRNWCKDWLLYKLITYFRYYIVLDFLYNCYCLLGKYNERYMYNFWYCCIYIVFLIVLFIMVSKFLKALKEDKDGNTT